MHRAETDRNITPTTQQASGNPVSEQGAARTQGWQTGSKPPVGAGARRADVDSASSTTDRMVPAGTDSVVISNSAVGIGGGGILSRAASANAAKKPFLDAIRAPASLPSSAAPKASIRCGKQCRNVFPPLKRNGNSQLEAPFRNRAPHFWPEITTPVLWKVSSEGHQIGISTTVMIVGNPKSCRTMAFWAVALVLLIVISTAFITMRKRTPSLKVLPMHPSTVTLSAI